MTSRPIPRAADFYRCFMRRAELRPSAIHGEGVHLLEDVSRGTIIANIFLSGDVHMATEEEIVAMWRDNPETILVTARLNGAYFIYGKEVDAECYLNHSDTPNAINTHGQTISLRDIKAGEELTIDYGFTLAHGQHIDTATGTVRGYMPQEALDKAAAILSSLMQR